MAAFDLRLLPRPARIEPGQGSVRIADGVAIVVGEQSSDATQRAASGLRRALTDLGAGDVPIRSSAAQEITAIALLVAPSIDLEPQAFRLTIDDLNVTVIGGDEAGLFYGAQALIQIARSCGLTWPALSIEDRPVLPNRGLMLDVSRGKVPTMATLTTLVETLAHYRYNHLQLYTEHTFLFPRHPSIGHGADPLTADDIRALDAVCRAHHVELVANLQSIGHQGALLKLPQYQHLAETSWNWTLATANEGSFALLDELYGDLLPAFSSPWFNVNADEPWDLGRGQSAGLAAEIGVGGVYLRHIERLHEMVTRGHGRTMMAWADMFWHYPDLVDRFPDDVLLLDWWYEAKPAGTGYDNVDLLANAGRPFWIAPGTSSWGAFFPRLDNAIANTLAYVRSGVAAGANGMLMTDWGDGGHYQAGTGSWYPYLWAAECAWSGGDTSIAEFEAAFDRLFLADGSGRATSALRQLGAAMQAPQEPNWLTTWNSAMALWEEPVDGKLAGVTPPAVVDQARAAAGAIEPLLPLVRDPRIQADLAAATSQIAFGCAKVETTRAIQSLLERARALPADAPSDARRALMVELDAAIVEVRNARQRLPALIETFEQRWLAAARPSEIGITLDRFARLTRQYDDVAVPWLERQRGRLAAGASLEPYDRREYAALWEETRRWVLELVAVIGHDQLPPDLQQWLADTSS